MRKKIVSKRVNKAIVLAAAFMLASTALPVAAFAEEGEASQEAATEEASKSKAEVCSEAATAVANDLSLLKGGFDGFKAAISDDSDSIANLCANKGDGIAQISNNLVNAYNAAMGYFENSESNVQSVSDAITNIDSTKQGYVSSVDELSQACSGLTGDELVAKYNTSISAVANAKTSYESTLSAVNNGGNGAYTAINAAKTKIGETVTFAQSLKAAAEASIPAATDSDNVKTAATAKEAAQSTYNEKETAKNSCESIYNEKQQTVDDLKADIETAKSSYNLAKDASLQAQDAYKTADTNSNTAYESYKTANQAYQDYKPTVTAAKGAYNTAESKVKELKENLAAASDDSERASIEAELATARSDRDAKAKTYKDSITEQKRLEGVRATALENYNDLHAIKEEKYSDYQTKHSDYETKKSALETLEGELVTARSERDEARTSYNDANSELQTAGKAVRAAEKEYDKELAKSTNSIKSTYEEYYKLITKIENLISSINEEQYNHDAVIEEVAGLKTNVENLSLDEDVKYANLKLGALESAVNSIIEMNNANNEEDASEENASEESASEEKVSNAALNDLAENDTKEDSSNADTTREELADGSIRETTKEESEDGTVKETVVEVAADGSIFESVKKVAADGKSSASVEVKKDENGKVTESVVTIDTQTNNNELAVSLSSITDMIAQNDAATKKNTTVQLTASDANGKEKYTVEVDAKALKAGAKLKIYAIDKNGNPVIVDASKNNVTITDSGEVKLNISGEGSFEIVTPKQAKAIEKEIMKSIKPAESSVTLAEGEKTTFKLDSSCNSENIVSITYHSDNANIKVNKNGKIIAKGKGTATITAKVTLANGKTKVIKMTVQV